MPTQAEIKVFDALMSARRVEVPSSDGFSMPSQGTLNAYLEYMREDASEDGPGGISDEDLEQGKEDGTFQTMKLCVSTLIKTCRCARQSQSWSSWRAS